MTRWRSGLMTFVVVLAACSDRPAVVVDLGVIEASGWDEPSIVHPDASPTGVDITVTVTTFGDDCTWTDRTDVDVNGLDAVIRPFDNNAVDSVCGDILVGYSHATTVRFARAGTATITVLGYAQGDRFGTVIERSSTLEIQ